MMQETPQPNWFRSELDRMEEERKLRKAVKKLKNEAKKEKKKKKKSKQGDYSEMEQYDPQEAIFEQVRQLLKEVDTLNYSYPPVAERNRVVIPKILALLDIEQSDDLPHLALRNVLNANHPKGKTYLEWRERKYGR